MNASTLIKICGITNPKLAAEAVHLNAYYIGIVMDEHSKRYVTVDQAKLIADSVKNAGGIPVAVFVDTPINEIISICEACDIKTVQLHGKKSRKEHHYLPHAFQRIYVMHVNQDGILYPDNGCELEYLDQKRDFILFDTNKGGSGQSFNWNVFKYTGKLPFFLAGGLTPNNIGTAIKALQPNGVDVSSGVETAPGIKDLQLIKRFIQSAKRA